MKKEYDWIVTILYCTVYTVRKKISENLNFNEYLLMGWSESQI